MLSIIQNIIVDNNNLIFGRIANTYAEIVKKLMPTDINYDLEDLFMEERKGYEILKGLCIYNMKQEKKPIELWETYELLNWWKIALFCCKKLI